MWNCFLELAVANGSVFSSETRDWVPYVTPIENVTNIVKSKHNVCDVPLFKHLLKVIDGKAKNGLFRKI